MTKRDNQTKITQITVSIEYIYIDRSIEVDILGSMNLMLLAIHFSFLCMLSREYCWASPIRDMCYIYSCIPPIDSAFLFPYSSKSPHTQKNAGHCPGPGVLGRFSFIHSLSFSDRVVEMVGGDGGGDCDFCFLGSEFANNMQQDNNSNKGQRCNQNGCRSDLNTR